MLKWYDKKEPMGDGQEIVVKCGDVFFFQRANGSMGYFSLVCETKDGKVKIKETRTGEIRQLTFQSFAKGLLPQDRERFKPRK